MPRILALDYGSKRVGVAETDDLQMIASPLQTVHAKDLIAFLSDYMSKYEVEGIVLGEPKRLDGTATDSTKMINEFAVHLGKKFPQVKIHRVDERFTSKMASQALNMAGASAAKKRQKGVLDAISAAIILQSYLVSKS